MFTGIVQELGRIQRVKGQASSLVLRVEAERVMKDLEIGASVAVNGVCLTASALGPGWFAADVMPETFHRTNLASLRRGSPVNLERAMSPGDRLDGHIVQGHVDGVGRLRGRRSESNATLFDIGADRDIMRYLVMKDSVAIDGISLTVAGLAGDSFSVSIIPRTMEETTLRFAAAGDPVNIEVNILGKYVEHFLSQRDAGSLSLETLKRKGFV